MCSNSKFQHRKIARQLVLYSSSILNPQCVPLRKLHYSHFSISRKWKWSCSVVSDSLPLVDSSPQSSSVHGILQARILEWVAVSFSRGSSQHRDQTQVSHIAGRCFNLCTTREAQNFEFPEWTLNVWVFIVSCVIMFLDWPFP